MDNKQRVQHVMGAMSQGRIGPLFETMTEDVTWRWMGVSRWSRTFKGKQAVVDTLFGGATDRLSPGSSVEVHFVHADGDFVLVEHSGCQTVADTTTTTAGSFGSRTG